MKYPRTPHLPYSKGVTRDDRMLSGEWFNYYKNQEIIITEKLDGSNSCFTKENVFARSHGAPCRNPWDYNLWNSNDGLYWKVKPLIVGTNETIYGENLYGEHSIHYDKLPCYWFMFAVNDGNEWYSWDDVKLMANLLELQTVPELWRGIINTEDELKSLVEKFVNEPSLFGPQREGVVLRLTNSFKINDFPKCVCKWVRPNHVQTDEHWTKNWKKATLVNNEVVSRVIM